MANWASGDCNCQTSTHCRHEVGQPSNAHKMFYRSREYRSPSPAPSSMIGIGNLNSLNNNHSSSLPNSPKEPRPSRLPLSTASVRERGWFFHESNILLLKGRGWCDSLFFTKTIHTHAHTSIIYSMESLVIVINLQTTFDQGPCQLPPARLEGQAQPTRRIRRSIQPHPNWNPLHRRCWGDQPRRHL